MIAIEAITRMVAAIGMANAMIVYSGEYTSGIVRTVIQQSIGDFVVDFSKAVVFSDLSGENANLEKISWPDMSGFSVPVISVADTDVIQGIENYHSSKFPDDKVQGAILEKVIISGENDLWYTSVSLPIAVLAVTLYFKNSSSKAYYVCPATGNVLGEAPVSP